MNCKNCEYAIKCRNLQDNEWYTRCTYEEGECVKITELEAQIEKMKNCWNCAGNVPCIQCSFKDKWEIKEK